MKQSTFFHINKPVFPSPIMSRALLVDYGLVVLEKKSKMFLKNTDTQTDGRRAKNDQTSSLKLSAQMN